MGLLGIRARAQRYPRASFAHRATHRSLPNGSILLRLGVQITNPGIIVLRFLSAQVWVQRVLPLSDEMAAAIAGGKTPIEDGQQEIGWPIEDERNSTWEKHDFEVEPGESDEVTYDFVLPGDLETVQIYSYFRNVTKRGHNIGWRLTTLYDFRDHQQAPVVEQVAEGMTGKGH